MRGAYYHPSNGSSGSRGGVGGKHDDYELEIGKNQNASAEMLALCCLIDELREYLPNAGAIGKLLFYEWEKKTKELQEQHDKRASKTNFVEHGNINPQFECKTSQDFRKLARDFVQSSLLPFNTPSSIQWYTDGAFEYAFIADPNLPLENAPFREIGHRTKATNVATFFRGDDFVGYGRIWHQSFFNKLTKDYEDSHVTTTENG